MIIKFRNKFHFIIFIWILCFGITACGEGSNTVVDASNNDNPIELQTEDNPVDTALETDAPLALILFPPPISIAQSNELTVTGTATDSAGVKNIVVNGVQATTDNNYQTWSATITLSAGVNQIVVKAEDQLGNVDESAARATVKYNELVLVGLMDVAYDDVNNLLYIVDDKIGLLKFNINTGVLGVLSETKNWEGNYTNTPSAIELDILNNRAFVVDSSHGALYEINLSTGAARVISGGKHTSFSRHLPKGSGPVFERPEDLVLDLVNDRILIGDAWASAIVEVNLTTGNRKIISGSSIGAGQALEYPQGLALDISKNLLYVADNGQNIILSVDIETGDRSIISGLGIGTGSDFWAPVELVLDVSAQFLIVADVLRDSLITVDLETGERSIFSGEGVGQGPDISEGFRGIKYDQIFGRIFGADWSGIVYSIDINTGDRSYVVNNGFVGNGPSFNTLQDIVIDDEKNRILAADAYGDGIISIDRKNGNRSIFGAAIGGSSSLVLDYVNNRVVSGSGLNGWLMSLDLDTGVKQNVSLIDSNPGPKLRLIRDIAIDAVNNRALVTDDALDAIIAVDFDSGYHSIVSSTAIGSGPAILSPRGLVVDADNNRVLMIEQSTSALLEVDLSLGNRKVISNNDVGSGPSLFGADGLVLDRDNNRVLVAKYKSVMAVDIDTGGRSILATWEASGSYSNLNVVFDLDANTVFLNNHDLNGIVAIELDSKNRVIISK